MLDDATPSRGTLPWQGGRVLVVDDDEALAQTIVAVLEEDFTVEAVPSVDEALVFLARTGVDVVVTDYEMPGGTGARLLRTLEASFPGTAAILMTGRSDAPEVRTINRSGLHVVLFKPFHPSELQTWVRNGVVMSRLRSTRVKTAKG